MASSPRGDNQGKTLLTQETPEASPGSAYLSCSSADFSFIPALPGSQGTSTSQRSELEKDNSFDAIFRSLQSHQQQAAPQAASNQQPVTNDFTDVPKPQGQSIEPHSQSAVDNLLQSFMAANQSISNDSVHLDQGNANNLIASLLKSAATRGQQSQSQPKSASDLLQQLLMNQMQQKQEQLPLQLPNAGDPLSSLIGVAQKHAQQQQQQQQGSVSAQRVEPTNTFTGLLCGASDSGRLGFQPASSGLGEIVNHMLSGRNNQREPEENFDTGFLTIPGCDDDQDFQASLQPETHDGSQQHQQQQAMGSCGNNPLLGSKRLMDDEEQGGGPTKAHRISEEGEEDAARQQHLQKLQEQSQTLKTANVMLSKYLEGLQGNLSEILAENWSFKILIGCLTSKKQSTNPLEQMISAKIASNPSVAIPMLKSIHMSAAKNASSQETDTAASTKDSVFQNMVGLLSAQKQVPST
jgi:hypothetical protein